MNKIYNFFILLLVSQFAMAQENNSVAMADSFRADGKIYVVIAVLAIILSGVFIYLFRIEKKIKSLESKKNES